MDREVSTAIIFFDVNNSAQPSTPQDVGTDPIRKWIHSYLSGREQYVVINAWSKVISSASGFWSSSGVCTQPFAVSGLCINDISFV